MAYDITVRGTPAVPIDVLEELERREPWYEVLGDAGGVLLTNSNTGVYVNFAPPDRGEGFVYSLNLHAPRFFAIEGFSMLQRLCAQHGWRIEGDRSLREWEHLRADAGPPAKGVRVTAERAGEVWRWNFELPQTRARFAQHDVSVPKIFFASEDGRNARTITFWPHGAHRIAFPGVDDFVYREGDGENDRRLDRAAFLHEAAYFVRTIDGLTVIDAPRFSVLQSAIERAARERYAGQIVSSDVLEEVSS